MKLGPRSSVLMIDYVKATHAGSYSCSASNLAGTDEYTTVLVVNGTVKADFIPRYLWLGFSQICLLRKLYLILQIKENVLPQNAYLYLLQHPLIFKFSHLSRKNELQTTYYVY